MSEEGRAAFLTVELLLIWNYPVLEIYKLVEASFGTWMRIYCSWIEGVITRQQQINLVVVTRNKCMDIY
jgi:hypothetical protein